MVHSVLQEGGSMVGQSASDLVQGVYTKWGVKLTRKQVYRAIHNLRKKGAIPVYDKPVYWNSSPTFDAFSHNDTIVLMAA